MYGIVCSQANMLLLGIILVLGKQLDSFCQKTVQNFDKIWLLSAHKKKQNNVVCAPVKSAFNVKD